MNLKTGPRVDQSQTLLTRRETRFGGRKAGANRGPINTRSGEKRFRTSKGGARKFNCKGP